MFSPAKYQGGGILSMRLAGTSDPMIDVGDVQAADLAEDTEVKSLPNMRGGGGSAVRKKRVTSRKLTLSFADWTVSRLAMALQAGVTSVTAGTATGESVTAKKGGVIRLANALASSIVVKDATDATTYTAGTDYYVTNNGLEIPAATGAICTAITAASPATSVTLHVSYAYSAQAVLELFTQADTTWEVHIDGLNDADGVGYTIDLWKWAPDRPAKLALLSTDYQTLDCEGELYEDQAKAPNSTWGRIKKAA